MILLLLPSKNLKLNSIIFYFEAKRKTFNNFKTNLHIFKRLQLKDINNYCTCRLSH